MGLGQDGQQWAKFGRYVQESMWDLSKHMGGMAAVTQGTGKQATDKASRLSLRRPSSVRCSESRHRVFRSRITKGIDQRNRPQEVHHCGSSGPGFGSIGQGGHSSQTWGAGD